MFRLLAWVLYQHFALPIATRRLPDFTVGDAADPYLLRWYLTPWRDAYADIPPERRTRWQRFVARLPNVYLHQFLRSDDDRALHDHPWNWASFLLHGHYVEVAHEPLRLKGGLRTAGADLMVVDVDRYHLTVHRHYSPGAMRGHRGEYAHRLVLAPGTSTWTLFFCGWRRRDWGFHCPQGWVHWRRFTDPATNGATIGRGCEP